VKLHIITIGKPKLDYAQSGWQEYIQRLKHYHHLRLTQIADKHNDATHILRAAAESYKVTLLIEGQYFNSLELAQFLEVRSQKSKEVSFIIGGPEGLPAEVIKAADLNWSLSALTFPHDLAMVIVLEALYRASTISNGSKYHK
jgi:23S rRNA (pseudouridine1915-N3)-methyltransferase